jgi:hypothetical protein
LLAVESSGRLVIIEVKLAGNAESRRAVIAQVPSYAGYLQGLDPQQRVQDQLAQRLVLRRDLPQPAWLDLHQARRLNRHAGKEGRPARRQVVAAGEHPRPMLDHHALMRAAVIVDDRDRPLRITTRAKLASCWRYKI